MIGLRDYLRALQQKYIGSGGGHKLTYVQFLVELTRPASKSKSDPFNLQVPSEVQNSI
jgi:hypothetical protein